jgi:predicted phage tail protein
MVIHARKQQVRRTARFTAMGVMSTACTLACGFATCLVGAVFAAPVFASISELAMELAWTYAAVGAWLIAGAAAMTLVMAGLSLCRASTISQLVEEMQSESRSRNQPSGRTNLANRKKDQDQAELALVRMALGPHMF